jgi:hypothetical protein
VGFSATPSLDVLRLFQTTTPFDSHSMVQAMDQGHILDVLTHVKFFRRQLIYQKNHQDSLGGSNLHAIEKW